MLELGAKDPRRDGTWMVGLEAAAPRREVVEDFLPKAGDSDLRKLMTLDGRLRGVAGLCGEDVWVAVLCSDMRLSDCESSVASWLFVDAR